MFTPRDEACWVMRWYQWVTFYQLMHTSKSLRDTRTQQRTSLYMSSSMPIRWMDSSSVQKTLYPYTKWIQHKVICGASGALETSNSINCILARNLNTSRERTINVITDFLHFNETTATVPDVLCSVSTDRHSLHYIELLRLYSSWVE